ncbi:MAG: hypothetical protein KDA98_11745 [Acidimicrobiales bacterium]|nr:hypothetical protein [Acidimicrobiales bacterium]
MIRRFTPIAIAAVLAFGAVGCSGDEETKPSVDEVSTALGDLGVPDEVAACIAEDIHGELSASVLNRLVDDGADAEGTDDELDEVSQVVQDASAACMAEVGTADVESE